jgi:hypothetical protein
MKDTIRAKEIEVETVQKRKIEDEREKDFVLREERSRT